MNRRLRTLWCWLAVDRITSHVEHAALGAFAHGNANWRTGRNDFVATAHDDVLMRNVPVKELRFADGTKGVVATVFDLFSQVDRSIERATGGLGIGLALVKGLVEMHGGRLWAESTGVNGAGSTFFVELPLEARITEVIEKQDQPQGEQQPAPAEEPEPKKEEQPQEIEQPK